MIFENNKLLDVMVGYGNSTAALTIKLSLRHPLYMSTVLLNVF